MVLIVALDWGSRGCRRRHRSGTVVGMLERAGEGVFGCGLNAGESRGEVRWWVIGLVGGLQARIDLGRHEHATPQSTPRDAYRILESRHGHMGRDNDAREELRCVPIRSEARGRGEGKA